MSRGPFLRILAVITVVTSFVACEQVFTYNVFSEFQRDPENLSTVQKKSYAEAAVESGDREAMQKAYNSIAEDALNSSDPELTSVATDLALGASGVNDVVPDLAEKALSGELSDADAIESTVKDALDNINTDSLENVSELVDKTRQNNGTVTEEQYALATAGLVAKKAKEAEADGKQVEDLTTDDLKEVQDFVDAAKQDLESRSESSETLDLFNDYINNAG